MKTYLKKTTLAALIAGLFFIVANANASTVPDTGRMSKMSSSNMNSKMTRKKKMSKMSDSKMSDSKMKPATGDGKM